MSIREIVASCIRQVSEVLIRAFRLLVRSLPQECRLSFLSGLDFFVQEVFQSAVPPERYPAEMREFERLYDRSAAAWHLPEDPTVEIQVRDKSLYTTAETQSVELEVGHFYYSFVRLVNPETILETGVWRGYSTCCLASALKLKATAGHIYAIDPLHIPHLWDHNDLGRYITWVPKRSQDALDDVDGVTFDLLVIDSYHDYETTFWEVTNFEPLLREGGYLLLHDSLSFDGVGAVVHQLMQNQRFEVVTLDTPEGQVSPYRLSGLTVIRKARSGEPMILHQPEYASLYMRDPALPPFLRRNHLLDPGNDEH